MIPEDSTIAAVSTPFGEGAIAILRLSGPQAVRIAGEIFRSRTPLEELPSRVQQFGKIVDGPEAVDDVLLSVHRAPASYTGEDVVEIHCHGGILVTRRVLDLLLAGGAASAEPGEFTRRAFLHGKMDLTQAEAVMDLIRAQTGLALRAAAGQLEGALGRRIQELRAALLAILAHVEAYIDFPDEDIDPQTGAALLGRVDLIRGQVARLLDTAGQGRVLREGLRTVIFGAPNVGKSSLLNRLLGYERAIVSHLPGTTRDTLEEVINLHGIPVRLIDTAGVRPSGDAVEQAGIARTRQMLSRADLVLEVWDASAPPAADLGEEPEARKILVLNKCDLGIHPGWQTPAWQAATRISCETGEGFEALTQAIVDSALQGALRAENFIVAINARHQACLRSAAGFLEAAREAMARAVSPEFVSIELRAALDAVGDIVGRADAEELLGEIFSTFCIGK